MQTAKWLPVREPCGVLTWKRCLMDPENRANQAIWQFPCPGLSRYRRRPMTGVVHVHWLLARC